MKSFLFRVGRFALWTLCALLPLWVAAVPARAGQFNTIDSVRPRFGQRGTRVEVVVSGSFLRDAQEITFYRPGVRVVSIEPNGKPPEDVSRWQPSLKCVFEIAPDCPAGEHVFRVRTPWTLSMAATFNVSPFPVVPEVEADKERGTKDNDSPAAAMAVARNTTVFGTIDGREKGDRDLYRVPVSPGMRLTVEVDCVRISDIPHTHGLEPTGSDLAVRVLDAKGRQLAANDDNPLHVQDPVVSLRIPNGIPPAPAGSGEGDFVYVEVLRPGFSSWPAPYVVHIGDYSRPMAAFPPGGPAGQPLEVRFLGDPLGEFSGTVAVPTQPGAFTHSGEGPWPLSLRSSPFPNVLEDAAAEATPVHALPAALNGVISKPGEVDRFRLAAKKGQRYRVRVFSAGLGTPLHAKLEIQPPPSAGAEAGAALVKFGADREERDIFGISAYGGSVLPEALDPSLIWEPKVDGEHTLSISDLAGGGAPTAVYRIEIEPPADGILTVLPWTLYWWEAPKWASLGIPRGERWTVNLNLSPLQGNTFKGECEIVAEGLPPGVRLLTNRVPAGAQKWPVQFEADMDAPLATAVIRLRVRSLDPNVRLVSGSQQNLPFLNSPGGDAWKTVRLDAFMLGVLEQTPFSIEIDEPSTAVVRGGELEIPVRLKRRNGFNEPVGFQSDWRPTGIGLPPQETIGPEETGGVLRISAEQSAPLGRQPFVVTANSKGLTSGGLNPGWQGDGQMRVSSRIVQLNVSEPFVELSMQPDSLRRGERKKMVWQVKHKTPFQGSAPVQLVGMPKGVNVLEPAPTIAPDSTQVAFEIEATDDALIGSVRDIACEVLVPQDGKQIKQRSGRGILRIDPRQ